MTSFTSLTFWAITLPIGLLIYYLAPPRLRALTLFLISLVYYAVADIIGLPILLFQIVVAFFVGKRLARAENDSERLRWLWIGLLPVVASLFLFKLGDGLVSLAAPLGVSYYTFKLISYLIEIYWDETQEAKDWREFAAFVAFAPQMVSGPIQRPGDFLEQIGRVGRKIDLRLVENGLPLLLNGLMLKLIIGDRLGVFVSKVDTATQYHAQWIVILGMICYLPRLYGDFAGYTNIALGIGRLFGIEGPPNFNAPFSATNTQDYWRRWHMSLTTWLTDYVFTPLRMHTRRWGDVGLVFSIFVNMILVGVWHKITWNFFLFGALQGAQLSVSALTLKKRDEFFARWPRLARWRPIWQRALLFLLMSASMTVWFAPSLSAAWLHFAMAFGVLRADPGQIIGIPDDVLAEAIICLIIALYHGAGAPGLERLMTPIRRVIPFWALQGVKILLISALTAAQSGGFIYGQF